MTTLELTGLKGHHPLGFLAACGVLRCCTMWNDFGRATLSWIERGGVWTPVIHLNAGDVDVMQLTQMLVCHGKRQRASVGLTWSTKIDDRSRYREAAAQSITRDIDADDSCAILAALASDIVTTDKGALQPTMFDLTSGNQRLLSSILSLAGEPKKKNGNSNLVTEEQVREALFGPWQYNDDDHSLGWDPQSQRLHALRHMLPEKDKANRSVRVAVFLASQALPLFPCFAVGGKLRTTGFHRENDDEWFSWPIWDQPITLDTLRSLLAHPPTRDLERRGVKLMYRCRRVRTGGSEGNYQVFSNAEELVWPSAR